VSDLNSLAERLQAIVEELDEIAFDRLRLAVADGCRTRPEDDRELTKARRAVEKAVAVLRRIDVATEEQTTEEQKTEEQTTEEQTTDD
jgi:hypothetical protein